MKTSSRRAGPRSSACGMVPFPPFRPLGLVISCVVINTGLLFISLFVTLCVKLDPGTHKDNAFSFSLKTGCDKSGIRARLTVGRKPRVDWMPLWTYSLQNYFSKL
jgi:hypothetical protein